MKCLNCNQHPAIKHPRFGYLPCIRCQNRTTTKPQKPQELTTDTIKSERKEHAPDIRQPFRNGEVDKKYIEQHGTKYIKVTDEEVKHARNMWPELSYYEDD